MSGGPNPMRLASHHDPRRAGSTSLCPPQLRKSGEKDSQMSAHGSVHGRWSSANRPSMRRGKSAASLSSGCMIMPQRSKVRKSVVSANATPGPPLLNAV
jgi:hypothetical protein